MRIPGRPQVEMERDRHGICHVRAAALEDLFYGLGYCHALDRSLQLQLMRILGQGRASELLDGSDAALAIDIFFRRMAWIRGVSEEAARLQPGYRAVCEAYCQGINARLLRKRPWELRMLGVRPEAWTVEDCLLLARMTGYLTLAQSQAEIERLLVELVQAGVGDAALEELFPGLLGGLDRALLQKVQLGERIVPEAVRWHPALSASMASNNWVVAGSRTASGKPMLANDPHLEINRVPNVWYEVSLESPQRYLCGASMPGLPGVIVGRNAELAWGATYTFMDAIDSWVEECRDGKFRRADSWEPFEERTEVIRRKGRPDHTVTFYENLHGVLDGDPRQAGFYLATRWASAEGGARSLEATQKLWETDSVEQGREVLGQIETSWNWVLADREGNIGYQMSGRLPLRREGVSGLVALPGWEPANDWQGFARPDQLPRCLNPEAGYFVTANNDLNRWGEVPAINVPMGDYRARRIEACLEAAGPMQAAEHKAIQLDVYSLQAQQFLELLRPLLPDTPQGKLLAGWDCSYGLESEGAFLFECFYRRLFGLVFGEQGLGAEVAAHLLGETGIPVDFYANFDRVLLAESSAWFGELRREDLFRQAAAEALQVEPRRWGDGQRLTLSHIVLGGKLPRWLGFDRGPIELAGGRATPRQGQIYRSAGRATSFAGSLRMVCDLAEDGLTSSLAGGPSDRRFSRWYCSELAAWQEGSYKRVEPRGE